MLHWSATEAACTVNNVQASVCGNGARLSAREDVDIEVKLTYNTIAGLIAIVLMVQILMSKSDTNGMVNLTFWKKCATSQFSVVCTKKQKSRRWRTRDVRKYQ